MKYWIWLSTLNLPNYIIVKLLEEYRKPERIWNLKEIDLKKLGLRKETIEIILDQKRKRNNSKVHGHNV